VSNTAGTVTFTGAVATGTLGISGGTVNFNGNVTGGALTTSSGTLNLGAGLSHSFTSWTRSSGAVNGGSSTLNLSGNASGSGTTFSAGTGTVTYSGAGQTVAGVTYSNLTLSGTGTKTTTGVTVNGNLFIQGTATVSAAPTYGPTALLQYNATAARVAGPEWPASFGATASRGVVVSNSGTITLNGAKALADGVPLFIQGSLDTSTSNYGLTLGGDFTNIGTFNANGSTITLSGAATQSIAGFTTTGGVVCSKSAGVATMTGGLNAGSLTNGVAGGTLSLGAGLTHTITGAWTRTAGTLDGGSSTLNVGGTVTNTGGSFTAGSGSVNYTGAAQTIAGVTYNNLAFSGSGTKSMPAGTSVSGNLSIAGTPATATLNAASSAGSLTLGGVTRASGTWGGTGSGATNINSSYFAATANKLSVGSDTRLTPTIAWANPADIKYPAALSASQLNASSGGVAGTFGYSPAAGTVLNAGAGQALSVSFTPSDPTSYKPATGSATINVTKGDQAAVTVAAPATASFGQTGLSATASGGSSSGAFSYDAGSSSACSVDAASGALTITSGTGSCSITATRTGDSNYNSSAVSTPAALVSVGKAAQAISFGALANRSYGAADFGPGATGGASGNPVSYASSDPTVATISAGGLIHIVGQGSATITASQAGNGNYSAAADVTQQLTVGKALITVTADNASRVFGAPDPAFSATYTGFVNGDSATVLSGAPVFSTTATASSPQGSYPITPAAGTLGAANYSFAFADGTLAVGLASQAISFNPLAAQSYGAAGFDLAFTPGVSGNPVSFASSDTGVATVSGSRVTIVGAGTTTITASQAGDNDYAAATAQQELVVSKAPLTVTAQNASRTYNTANPALSYAYSGFVNSDDAGVLSGAPVLGTSAVAGSPVGSYPITVAQGTLAAANYSFGFVGATLAVGQASQSIGFDPIPGKSYGAVPFDLSATGGASGYPVSFSSADPGVATVSGTTVTIVGAGSTTITASQAGDANYSPATAQQTLTVGKALLAVTANDASRPYNTANPAFSASYSGFVYSDSQASLAGAPALSSVADLNSPVGNYLIIPAVGNLFSNNYDFSYLNGTLAIGKATPAIAWSNPADIRTGSALGDTQLNATAPVPGSFAYSPVAGTLLPVGLGQPLTVTFTPNDAADYSTATSSVQINVVPKTVPAITWTTPAAIGYGTALSATQLNAAASTPGTFAYTPALGAVLPAGLGQTLSVTFTPNDAVNYSGATASVQLNVAPAPLSVAATAKSKTFGQSDPPLSYSAAGFVNGESAAIVTGALARVAGETAGSYAILQGSLSAGANYALSYTGANLTIDPAPQTISFGALANRSYGAADFGPGAAGGASGNPVSYASSDSTVASITAGGLIHIVGQGTTTITASQAGGVNYGAAADVSQSFTVDKAQLSVTANNANRLFGAADPAFSATYSGFVNGDSAAVLSGSPAFSSTADVNSPAGSYPLTPAAGTLGAANYSFVFVDGTLAIGLASQSIGFNPLPAKTYGATSFQLAYTPGASGNPVAFASSDSGVATVSGSTVTIVGAGTATITASQAGNADYASATAQQELAVGKALLTVAAQNASRGYNTANPALNYLYSGFVNGEDAGVLSGAPVISTSALTGSPVASYPITVAQGTLTAANYGFSFVGATLAVGQASQSIGFDPIPGTSYGAVPFDLSATGGASGNPVSFSSADPGVATVTGSTVTIVGAGSTTITANQAGNANYAPATAQQTLSVGKATLTVTANGASRSYNTANPAFGASYAGFVYNEGPSVLLGAAALSSSADIGSPVGSYPIVAAVGNLASNNYDFSYVNGTLTIGQATPAIAWSNPADIKVGTALGGPQLNATSPVPGSFAYTPAAGTALPLGSGQTLSVSFTPADPVNYSSASASVLINVVAKNVPAISWPSPAGISYGTALSGAQLNATSPVPGSFAYTPALGTVLGAGNGQTLSATFTPADAVSFASTTASVQLNVAPASLTVSAAAKTKVYGQPDPALSYSATGLVNGDNPAVVTGSLTRTAGENFGSYPIQQGSVGAGANYTVSYTGATLSITKATPALSWPTPASVAAGTALSATQLNATSPVPGSFAYTPVSGTLLSAGNGQTLSVTFTPADALNYSSATASVLINVAAKTVPTVTWSNPAAISFGTALSGTQLNATASVPGSFAYTPAAGALPSVGSQTLSVTFVPADPASYSSVTTTVTITVNPVVSSSTPVPVSGPPAGTFNDKAGTSFTILRSEAGGTFSALTTITAKSFTDGAVLKPNTVYQYAVSSNSDPVQTVFMTVRTPLFNGWNVIAVPYDTTGVPAASLFASPVSSVYQWNSSGATSETATTQLGAYATVANLTPGHGYFAKASNGSSMLVYDGAAVSGPVTVTLKPGWTMIANPGTSNMVNIGDNWLIDGVPLRVPIVTDPSHVSGSIYWWNGTTYDSWTILGDNPQIEPWKGYWMQNLDSMDHLLTIQ